MSPAPTPPATNTPTSPLPVVQRFWKKPKTTTKNAPKNTTGALAAAAAATIANTLTTQTAPPPYTPSSPPQGPPPPYAESAPTPAPTPTSASTSAAANQPPPPAYTEIPNGGFDPRELTDFQLDELVHRLIGRITRLIRTELRMDRERIGRLRDPRH
ncbi:extensin [Streptomyces sp. NPDC050546]|uniref:extensin n=1 Tax=Streptomyces sp. NPDC050546 TaxID=3365628 RepID=UPI00379EEC6F